MTSLFFRLRRFRHPLLFGAVFGLLGAADQPRAPHGALDMQVQQQLLEQLQAGRDTGKPAMVDGVIWKFLIPDDNEQTAARAALGKKLYFDTRLSLDNTVACATCHDVSRGFTDQRMVSEGINDQLGKRNAPTTLNALFFTTQFLDGRAPSLEEQAKLPIINPIEMGQPDPASAVAAIAADPDYQRMFQEAYSRAPNYDDIGRAIAAFERTLVFLEAPLDRFLKENVAALSEQARRGWELFNGKARCMSCHMLNPSNPTGTNNRFHNIGVSARKQDFEALAQRALKALEGKGVEAVDQLALQTDMSELGRFMVTKNRSEIGAFKTSQLRNIALTAPYMHDGSMRTLWDVMDHYNRGGEPNPFLDGGIEPLNLTEAEINAVVAFMFTLTDVRFAEQNRAALREQLKLASENRPFRESRLANRDVLPFETLVESPQE